MIYSKISGEGVPFLIIHGFLGMSDNWKTFGSELSECGYEVHLLDMRNHGRSFHSSEFSYALMVEDVKEYCLANHLENVILMGHSMGGKVVMDFATKYPEMAQKIIVVDISPRYYPPHHQDILQALQSVDFYEGMGRKEVQEQISKTISDQAVVQFLMKNVYRETKDLLGYRFNLDAFLQDDTKIGEALAPDAIFEKPTLFVKGQKSGYIQQNDELLIYKHFPKSKIVEIANAGHWVHADNPKDLMTELTVFLKDN